MIALVGLESVNVNDLAPFTLVSLLIGTSTVFEVWPAAKVSAPLTDV